MAPSIFCFCFYLFIRFFPSFTFPMLYQKSLIPPPTPLPTKHHWEYRLSAQGWGTEDSSWQGFLIQSYTLLSTLPSTEAPFHITVMLPSWAFVMASESPVLQEVHHFFFFISVHNFPIALCGLGLGISDHVVIMCEKTVGILEFWQISVIDKVVP